LIAVGSSLLITGLPYEVHAAFRAAPRVADCLALRLIGVVLQGARGQGLQDPEPSGGTRVMSTEPGQDQVLEAYHTPLPRR
jgi:hypothetical protein